jgi:hypothetical protein
LKTLKNGIINKINTNEPTKERFYYTISTKVSELNGSTGELRCKLMVVLSFRYERVFAKMLIL